jgi:ZIP family zinc transporter
MQEYLLPLLLTTIAGLATAAGALVTFLIKGDNTKALSFGLGLSCGAMIFISLFSFLPDGKANIILHFGENFAWIALLAFGAGLLAAASVDYLIPDHKRENDDAQNTGLVKKAGTLTFLAIMLHNFPEGLVTFFSGVEDIKLGLIVVFTIAIHNIPEGIAIAIPVYAATKSRLKAFLLALLAGLAEPVGGVLGYILLSTVFREYALGLMFAFVAGIMVYIALDTLLPLSRKYDTAHYSITGVSFGMLLVGAVFFL